MNFYIDSCDPIELSLLNLFTIATCIMSFLIGYYWSKRR